MPIPAKHFTRFLPLLLVAGCATSGARSPRALVSSTPAALATPAQQQQEQEHFPLPEIAVRPRWPVGHPVMQGFIGVSAFNEVTVEGDGGGRIDGDEGDLDRLPLIGGGGQWKMGGRRMDFGLEGMLSFSGRADAEAFVIGGGGAAVAVDVDLLVLEFFGGPFASLFLGDRLRVYGGAGPLLQFADYEQEGNGLADDGSGFGSGWYARTGLEFTLPSRTLIGFGVRWSDTTVDLGGGLGDLEIDGLQGVVTVSRGI